MKCNHEYKCIDSRPHKGNRYRKYKCLRCDEIKKTVELDMGKEAPKRYVKKDKEVALSELLGVSVEKARAIVSFVDALT